MKQPHIYTLPERFIKDPSVPLKWKLYTIINGFWISGKPVFASNAWFAEKLGCSDRHVRDCLVELEKDFLVTRHGKSQNRKILPCGARGGTGSSTLDEGGGTGSSVREELGVPHISDSISDSITAVAEVTISETETAPSSKKNTPDMLRGYEIFSDNPARRTFKLKPIERESMKALLEEYGHDELVRRYAVAKKYRGEEMCPLIKSPSTFLEKMPNMEKFLKSLKS